MEVKITDRARKQIRKLPPHIVEQFKAWVDLVREDGLTSVQRINGYRDEALKGDRKGQRSSRLNKAYRVIYTEDGTIVEVLEVNNHEY